MFVSAAGLGYYVAKSMRLFGGICYGSSGDV